ncbi:MAG: glycosyltransferase [Planctomycetes bacterium]|nr:glycosyltransferase [Planctomycetota bacterium]
MTHPAGTTRRQARPPGAEAEPAGDDGQRSASTVAAGPDAAVSVDAAVPLRTPLADGFRSLGDAPARVLFFGKSRSRTRATRGFVEAFRRHGADARWVNFARLRRRFGRRLALAHCRRLLARWRPELVFAVHPDLPLELLREIRGDQVIAQWVDQPLVGDDPRQLESLGGSDVVFMTAPSRFSRLRDAGVERLVPMLEAFAPSDHHPAVRSPQRDAALVAEPSLDVVFIGGPGRDGRRGEELVRVAADLRRRVPQVGRLRIHGNGWRAWRASRTGATGSDTVWRGPLRPRGYRRACARSRVVLGLNEFNDEPLYYSNRTVLTLACGGFHVTHYVPGLEEVFRDREHLVWFHGREEAVELIAEYLDRPAERAAIAAAGLDLVRRRHRFVDRVAEILRVLRTGTYLERPWAAEPAPPEVTDDPRRDPDAWSPDRAGWAGNARSTRSER